MIDRAVAVGARVVRVDAVGSAGTRIDLEVSSAFPVPRAGQFVQVECNDAGVFRLRRPFSICHWWSGPSGSELGILFSIVGEGSGWLAARRPGDRVEICGPLGTPFRSIPGRAPVLVGGGRGVAPLLLFADQIAETVPDGVLLYGARDAAAVFPTEGCPFPVYRATLDGSVGHEGTAIDLLDAMLRQGAIREESSVLFGCGPLAMLRALSGRASSRGVPLQVSVETVFGCGTGICAGCAIPILACEGEPDDPFHRYALACTDGPVFDAMRIDWNGVRE